MYGKNFSVAFSTLSLLALLGMIAAAIVGLAATPAIADPLYSLLKTIPVPSDAANVQPGGAFTSFDISFFDPVTRNDYVADRSNASVDIFSGASLTFLGRATGFTGQGATTSVSGADGVLTVTSGGITTLYAGDGNSTLKVFNATNPAAGGPEPAPVHFHGRCLSGRRNGVFATHPAGPGREQRRRPCVRDPL